MYTIISRLHHIRKHLLLGCLCALPLSMIGQVEESALNHLLQRRQVAKHYEDKIFGDHVFIEAGMGANTTFTGYRCFPYMETPGMQATGAIGDWVTPLHGWRVGINGGTRVLGKKKTKTLGFSADYLLNLTALSRPQYKSVSNWEFIATAGIGCSWAHYDRDTRTAQIGRAHV